MVRSISYKNTFNAVAAEENSFCDIQAFIKTARNIQTSGK